MNGSLEALEDWAAPLLRKLAPAERGKLARSLAQQLRRNQQQRVKAQANPDGSKYTPRKARDLRGKKGHIRRKADMFQKLRKVAYLKAKGDGSAISVGFTGRVARIARVHQYGLRDRAEPGAPDIRYEQREILGFTDGDIDLIRDKLLLHLTI
ncbi:virion morphogenesis protein [Pseudomonas antarctica]|uniref:Virion morphogenesis protein n=1 Tax=Pseudomonas antarctica TaxID=219572 RepID=A0A172Z5C8_9PSED|nr:phage virion morphogenesis protein [Pseudomonas antarctica]ANF87743.1 virion morphogenesis protein [Pseudomonas antarctica]